VNLILAIPLEVRLAALFVLGTCVGSLANLGVYRLALRARSISPWSRPEPAALPRRLTDRLPVVGWLGLRREAGLHGAGFWIRPLLLELLCGVGFAALYWWEIECEGLLPPHVHLAERPDAVLHIHYAGHLVLIALMLVASLIDVDEKIIPDTITVPGTLAGLLLAAVCTGPLLPVVNRLHDERLVPHDILEFMWVTAPCLAPPALGGFPHAGPLAIGLGCWWFWCVALLPRSWHGRHGWRRALQLFWARLARERSTYWILIMGVIGSAATAAIWYCGGPAWLGLLTALVGMAGAAALVWAVRIIGAATLKREAMGFGDVTLMAMIGAFLGWQAGLIVFFLAPLAGLVVGLLQLILLRDSEIPYGPFLCLAALAVIVFWTAIWDWAADVFALIFQLGWIMPVVALGCLAVMAALLRLLKGLRGLFGG
jgi:prepilin signal peptidase PulO-like enzyme (type II secretory pathway)